MPSAKRLRDCNKPETTGIEYPRHMIKQQRLLRLRHQRRHVARIDGLGDLQQLVVLRSASSNL